jgi:5-formyltetrahydrofolate cyclo-ligase
VDVAEAKRELRREILAKRRAISAARREAAGHAVVVHVLAIPAVRAAANVALYAATADELPTRPLFEALAGTGCRRLLPGIRGDVLAFARVDAWTELEPGPLGLLTPRDALPVETLDAGDVVVVPGVAFDTRGARLGRGGGYYDRTFAAAGPLLMGIAFDLQIVDRLPTDSHDRAMGAIVTERGLRFWAGKT